MSQVIFLDTSFGLTKSCIKLVANEADHSIIHSIFQENAIGCLQAEKYNPQQVYVLLLPESSFKFYSFDILHVCTRPCTITTINHIIAQKLIHVRKDHGDTAEKLFIVLDTIYVNGERCRYLINKVGTIFFRLSFVFLDTLPATNLHFGCNKFMQNSTFQIFPASFFTMQFIKKYLEKESFFLLYIHDAYAKLVYIRNGFYKDVQIVNIGVDMLKDIYNENGILDYFFAPLDVLEKNSIIKEIATQSVDFFTQMLAKWLREYISGEQDVILISSLTKNVLFQEQFNKWYNFFINGFVVPFCSSSYLDTWGRKRSAEELDILTMLNMQDKLKEIIW